MTKARIHQHEHWLHRPYKRDRTNTSRLCRFKYLSSETADMCSLYSVSQNVSTCQIVTTVTETTEILVSCEALMFSVTRNPRRLIKIYVYIIMHESVKIILIICYLM
jgi:hypothetical protein